MTWFGIIMFLYYCANIMAAFYYAGKGGLYSGKGALVFTALVNVGFLVAILYVGTGLGVL